MDFLNSAGGSTQLSCAKNVAIWLFGIPCRIDCVVRFEIQFAANDRPERVNKNSAITGAGRKID
jgi:hypothetical protein